MLESDFVGGAITFIDEWDQNSRIVIPVNFGNKLIIAIVDTGAPYCIIAPNVADEIGIDRSAGHRLTRGISTRMGRIGGWLCNGIPVTLEAERGNGIKFETTAFIPDEGWPVDLNFIGLTTFLFEIRFAVDPRENLFYFGGPI
jgi:hypothetical protein